MQALRLVLAAALAALLLAATAAGAPDAAVCARHADAACRADRRCVWYVRPYAPADERAGFCASLDRRPGCVRDGTCRVESPVPHAPAGGVRRLRGACSGDCAAPCARYVYVGQYGAPFCADAPRCAESGACRRV